MSKGVGSKAQNNVAVWIWKSVSIHGEEGRQVGKTAARATCKTYGTPTVLCIFPQPQLLWDKAKENFPRIKQAVDLDILRADRQRWWESAPATFAQLPGSGYGREKVCTLIIHLPASSPCASPPPSTFRSPVPTPGTSRLEQWRSPPFPPWRRQSEARAEEPEKTGQQRNAEGTGSCFREDRKGRGTRELFVDGPRRPGP